jgi:hypothetical protein
MATSDTDIEQLISELGASLIPPQRTAFAAAAQVALQGCSGPGAAYRVLRDLQRLHFDPPSDARAIMGARHHRASKLTRAEPIGAPDPREDGRLRRQFRAV